ncbi:MAG: AAA family ATPase [Aliidongia sp.]
MILSGCFRRREIIAAGGTSAGAVFAIYEEPGRQVVKEQLFIGGTALPWADIDAFVELTVSRSIHNLVMAARADGPAFFDRSIVDQIAGLVHLGRPIPPHLALAAERFRCHRRVFMLPPWPEIFANDAERRHSFEAAADKL